MGPSHMESQTHFTEVGNRVRLKVDGQDQLYKQAYAGSEGWVTHQKHDEYGYPLIFVEWDKHHWAYNGEKDIWTYESHFDVLPGEDKVKDKKNLSDSDFEKFKQWLALQNEDEKPKAEKSAAEKLEELRTLAQESLKNATGFALFVVREEKGKEEDTIFVPALVYANGDDNPVAKLLLDMQVSQVAAALHREITLNAIEAVIDDEGDED